MENGESQSSAEDKMDFNLGSIRGAKQVINTSTQNKASGQCLMVHRSQFQLLSNVIRREVNTRCVLLFPHRVFYEIKHKIFIYLNNNLLKDMLQPERLHLHQQIYNFSRDEERVVSNSLRLQRDKFRENRIQQMKNSYLSQFFIFTSP